MKQYIFEVFEAISKAKTQQEKVQILKDHNHHAVRDVIRGSMDPRVTWNLPPGTPPYTPCKPENAPTNLYRANTKFAYFVKGGRGDSLPAFKRESIFISLLEGVHPKDAELLINMIQKKSIKGVTKKVVDEAFPGLL